mmetsp:Transcript_39448/g.63182  ORF Transcript_39448/g.63182 Transcript_39448/m.63182 type:complete len:83 (+) Transcript_39448:3542-3790(+)
MVTRFLKDTGITQNDPIDLEGGQLRNSTRISRSLSVNIVHMYKVVPSLSHPVCANTNVSTRENLDLNPVTFIAIMSKCHGTC